MRTICIFFLGLLMAGHAWSQVQPSASGTPPEVYDSVKMEIPPPASGDAYPDVVGGEARTNYITGQVLFETAYDDNVYAGNIAVPVSDTTFTLLPMISYDRTEPRQKQTFSYSPGFTFYTPTSELNAIDQSAKAGYTYRISPYTAVSVYDTFLQTSNLLGQTGAFTGGGVSGTAGGAGQTLLIPYAEELSNVLRGSAEKQFSRNQMFGVGGNFGLLDYPNPSQAPGLYNSKTAGASAFYAQRFSLANYFGITFDYAHIAAYPPNATSTAQTNGFMPFFTLFFNRTTSISVAAGPQHYSVMETGLPDQSAWTPEVSVSAGWQKTRTNLNVAFDRSVTAGGGLLGAYEGTNGTFSGRFQVSRLWILGADFNYSLIRNVTPLILVVNPGGHRVGGDLLISRKIGEHFGIEFGYDRLHQSYSGIALLAGAPDSNRGYGSIFYQFRKPLGQ